MSPRFRGTALAVALAILTGAAVVLNARIVIGDVQRMTESDRWVVHTHEVLQVLQQLLLSLVDAETGERGFIITGDERYLEPYEAGRNAVQGHLARLVELTADDPSQHRRVQEIRLLVTAELAHLEKTSGLRRTNGFIAARLVVLSKHSRRLMDEVRGSVASLVQEQNVLLEDRTRASAAAARRAITSTLLGSLASLALLAFCVEVGRRRLRERAAAAIRAHEEKERFRTTLTSVGDAVVVTDAQGAITMLNPSAATLMHCGDEVIGRPLDAVFLIVDEETRRPVESPVRRVLREGRIAGLTNHTVLLWPDGGEVPIDDSAAPIKREDGAVVGAVLVFRDIRERRRAERAQQRAAEFLKEQDRRKDRFLAMLSHELRNPLSPMRTGVKVLQHEGATAEQRKRAVKALDRQVTHLARLVDDLLDISRIAQGKIRFEKNQVNLAALVHRSVEDFQGVFARRQIALEFRNEAAPLWVEADATRLAQVVANLLQNAAKFTDPGGRVTVALAREDDRARLEVRDDGAGMDAATLANLFQPFMRSEGSVRPNATGLGLGLALSRSLVELQGGTMRASSDGPGQGAAFVVELPLLASLATASTPSTRRRPTRPLRILVVDDNEDAAATLHDLLELEHHEVLVAPDAETGIVLALQQDPDVVLCDVGLPGIDGYEAARRLRAAGSEAMLVALTGHASSEDVQLARQAGFEHHLAKPVELSTLMDVLATATSRTDELPAPPANVTAMDQHP